MDTRPGPDEGDEADETDEGDEGAEMTALAHEPAISATLDDFTTRPTTFIAALPSPKGVRVEFIERNHHMTPPDPAGITSTESAAPPPGSPPP